MTATTARKPAARRAAAAPQPARETTVRKGPQMERRRRAAAFQRRLPFAFHLTWITTALLLVAGLCMILSVSTAVTSGDKFAYVKNQGITAAVGVCLLVLVSRIDYRRLRTLSVAFLAVVVLSLLAGASFPDWLGVEGGSASWIPLGPLTFQPSEFAKLAVVLFGAHLLTSPRVADGRFWSYMWPFGVTGLVMCALVYLEGDLGTAIIIAGPLDGDVVAGGHEEQPLGSSSALAGLGGALGLTLRSSVRMSRILSFLEPVGRSPGFELPVDAVADRAWPGRLVRGRPGAERAEVPVPSQGADRHDLRHPGRGVRPAWSGRSSSCCSACSRSPAGGLPAAAGIRWANSS